MVKTVVREHHWTPDVIDNLYVDAIDHHGLIFWFNDIKDVHEQMKKK